MFGFLRYAYSIELGPLIRQTPRAECRPQRSDRMFFRVSSDAGDILVEGEVNAFLRTILSHGPGPGIFG